MNLLTLEEVASMLKVRKSWVYARTCASTKMTSDSIPCISLGKYIRFDESEVIEWVKRQQRKGKKDE